MTDREHVPTYRPVVTESAVLRTANRTRFADNEKYGWPKQDNEHIYEYVNCKLGIQEVFGRDKLILYLNYLFYIYIYIYKL